ncbi:MAG: hypothetical protein Q9160_007093, partial [Pyrenula sp. 1 TL-2023]
SDPPLKPHRPGTVTNTDALESDQNRELTTNTMEPSHKISSYSEVDGGKATKQSSPIKSGLNKGRDLEREAEKVTKPSSRYESASKLLESDVRTVHYGNKIEGRKSEARYGEEYNNAPRWFVEQQRQESANRTASVNNTTSGEQSKAHYGNQWNFKPSGDDEH